MITRKFAVEYLKAIGWTLKGTKAEGYRIYRTGVRCDPWSYETNCLEDAIGTAEASNKHQRLVVPV